MQMSNRKLDVCIQNFLEGDTNFRDTSGYLLTMDSVIDNSVEKVTKGMRRPASGEAAFKEQVEALSTGETDRALVWKVGRT